jgi:hypothetical protein
VAGKKLEVAKLRAGGGLFASLWLVVKPEKSE